MNIKVFFNLLRYTWHVLISESTLKFEKHSLRWFCVNQTVPTLLCEYFCAGELFSYLHLAFAFQAAFLKKHQPVHQQLQSLLKLMSIESVMPSNHLILCLPLLLRLQSFQHQGLFKWVSSSHQMAVVLEFQLQHQSFQWTPRTDLFWDGLVGWVTLLFAFNSSLDLNFLPENTE